MQNLKNVQMNISTHAPHARRDLKKPSGLEIYNISTHAPHARRDYDYDAVQAEVNKFLLTRLMRGATRTRNT